MRVPTCDCLKDAFARRFRNNPHYGCPEVIAINHEDRVVVTMGKYGTVRLRSRYCPVCGKPYEERGVL
jgi:hypothetical protein